jgi:hypothetical protein
MAVSETDPVSAAKVLATLAREIPALKAKGGVLEGGEVLDAEAVAYSDAAVQGRTHRQSVRNFEQPDYIPGDGPERNAYRFCQSGRRSA